jgi:prepilin-type N-terminal cleavage/methylation domain-containing protein
MRNRGFTLLEVSMVLVIIAFIVGAITVGSNLIRNAQIQSISGEYSQYLSAVKAFQDKYQALPGDFSTSSVSFPGATNGNGDGIVSGLEEFYAWKHLVLAGLIEGTYTGADIAGGGSYDRDPGTNIPKSQLAGAAWAFVYVATSSTDIAYQTGDVAPGNAFWLGGKSVTGNNSQQNPVLTSEEADLIDRKMDDGLPYVGKVVSQVNASGTACQTGAAPAVYNVAVTGKICALVFKTGY